MKCQPVTKCCRLFSFLVQDYNKSLVPVQRHKQALDFDNSFNQNISFRLLCKTMGSYFTARPLIWGHGGQYFLLGDSGTFSKHIAPMVRGEQIREMPSLHKITSKIFYSIPFSPSGVHCWIHELNDYCKEEKEYLIRSWVVWWRKRGTNRHILWINSNKKSRNLCRNTWSLSI